MRNFFYCNRFKLVLVLVGALIAVMVISAPESEAGEDEISQGNILENFSRPLRKLSSSITNKVEKEISYLTKAKEYDSENAELRAEIARLRGKLVDYERMKAEIDHLRQYADIQSQYVQYDLSPPCTVIKRTPNDPFKSFEIDRGANNGITLYSPVITEEGLVGIVSEVGADYAKVSTIFSPNVGVGAMSVQTMEIGTVEGEIALAEKGLCKLTILNSDCKIKPGNLVVTSGKSGRFPQDFVIGIIMDISVDNAGFSTIAQVRPAVDISNVSLVYVIREIKGAEGTEASPPPPPETTTVITTVPKATSTPAVTTPTPTTPVNSLD